MRVWGWGERGWWFGRLVKYALYVLKNVLILIYKILVVRKKRVILNISLEVLADKNIFNDSQQFIFMDRPKHCE